MKEENFDYVETTDTEGTPFNDDEFLNYDDKEISDPEIALEESKPIELELRMSFKPRFITYFANTYFVIKDVLKTLPESFNNYVLPDGTSFKLYSETAIDVIDGVCVSIDTIKKMKNEHFIINRAEQKKFLDNVEKNEMDRIHFVDFNEREKAHLQLEQILLYGKVVENDNLLKSNKECLDDVLQYFDNPVKKIPTGINAIDKHILNGGYSYGLHIIQGMTGTGKTSLLLQMADYIAKGGTDVLYFSLEMSKEELIAKSLSRIAFDIVAKWQNSMEENDINKYCLSADDILQHKVFNQKGEYKFAYTSALDDYRTFSDKLYYVCSIGVITIKTIKDILSTFLEEHKNSFIIIDYLQLISATDSKISEYDKLNDVIMTLKYYANEFKIPIVCISSMNRQSYEKESKVGSSSGSSRIEYTANTLIEIRRDSELSSFQRKLIINNLKNRFADDGNSSFNFIGRYGKYIDNKERERIIASEVNDELVF